MGKSLSVIRQALPPAPPNVHNPPPSTSHPCNGAGVIPILSKGGVGVTGALKILALPKREGGRFDLLYRGQP